MKKLALGFALVVSIISYSFITSKRSCTIVKNSNIQYQTTIDATLGYSFVNVPISKNPDINSYLYLANTPYNESKWDWFAFSMKIDLSKEKVTHSYLIDRPEKAPDVFKTETLKINNAINKDSMITFDTYSEKFGTMKCLIFTKKSAKPRMLILLNDPEDKNLSRLMILKDGHQVE